MRSHARLAGYSAYGELGNDSIGSFTFTPVSVAGGIVFSQISASYFHTCGLNATGHAFCWGEPSTAVVLLQLSPPAAAAGSDTYSMNCPDTADLQDGTGLASWETPPLSTRPHPSARLVA